MSEAGRYSAFYDEQCEICQAGASWLRLLDKRGVVEILSIEESALARLAPDVSVEDALRQLHVMTPDGELVRGFDAVARLAMLFRPTRILGRLGRMPGLRQAGTLVYRWLAANRYALSKCRGGACRVASPHAVRRKATLLSFWSCYTTGLFLRMPLIVFEALRIFGRQIADHLRTRRKRVNILTGKLDLLFLGSPRADFVPLLFGERFLMVLYRGVAVDPGSIRMRRSLARHLRRLPARSIRAIVATHHHEEHVGNLGWLAGRTGVPVFVSEKTAKRLRPPKRIPRMRAAIIGQPPSLEEPFTALVPGTSRDFGGVILRVLAAPGHCDDHVVLYDPEERVLIAGDAFMGAYFVTPNPDVDSCRWIETLDALLGLEIDILVEGHGLVHTLRRDVPEIPGIVVRRSPREELLEKRELLTWLRQQLEAGLRENLPTRAVEATCFPWGRRWAWEHAAGDELARWLSGGEFSRTELVRSFVRNPARQDVLPKVFEARFHRG